MARFEYLVLLRDKTGRWQERGPAGEGPVDLEARLGPFLTTATTRLTEAVLLNGYGQHGWEMALGERHGGELTYIVLKRRCGSRGGREGAETGRRAAILKGALAGALAAGLAGLLVRKAALAADENGREEE